VFLDRFGDDLLARVGSEEGESLGRGGLVDDVVGLFGSLRGGISGNNLSRFSPKDRKGGFWYGLPQGNGVVWHL
jgi:hypothetical protein